MCYMFFPIFQFVFAASFVETRFPLLLLLLSISCWMFIFLPFSCFKQSVRFLNFFDFLFSVMASLFV